MGPTVHRVYTHLHTISACYVHPWKLMTILKGKWEDRDWKASERMEHFSMCHDVCTCMIGSGFQPHPLHPGSTIVDYRCYLILLHSCMYDSNLSSQIMHKDYGTWFILRIGASPSPHTPTPLTPPPPIPPTFLHLPNCRTRFASISH